MAISLHGREVRVQHQLPQVLCLCQTTFVNRSVLVLAMLVLARLVLVAKERSCPYCAGGPGNSFKYIQTAECQQRLNASIIALVGNGSNKANKPN